MNSSVFCVLLAVSAISVLAEEAELKTTTLPPRAYNILRGVPGEASGQLEFLGWVSKQDDASIVGKAATLNVAEDGTVKLLGQARIEISVGGKLIATYAADHLAMVPSKDGLAPIDHKQGWGVFGRFDAAFAKRDPAALAACFTANASVSLEEVSKNGVETKKLTATEFADYLCKLLPGAWNIEPRLEIGNVNPANDGSGAVGYRRLNYLFTLPQGILPYAVEQKVQLVREKNEVRIQSLEFNIPERERQNIANGGSGGRPALPRFNAPLLPRN